MHAITFKKKEWLTVSKAFERSETMWTDSSPRSKANEILSYKLIKSSFAEWFSVVNRTGYHREHASDYRWLSRNLETIGRTETAGL